jgi:hypothetical protein
MKRKCRSALGLILTILLIFGDAPASAGAMSAPGEMSSDVSRVLIRNIPEDGLKPGSVGGEWTVVALARAGYREPDLYNRYYENVVKEVESDKGILSAYQYTDYSRVILGLTAIGRDPRDVGGYDLIQPLADFDKVAYQGINGPIWALIALDSKEYEMPQLKGAGGTQNSREKMVDEILSKEIGRGTDSAGGWALSGSAPDPDLTAMALQALSNYRDRCDVRAVVERGVNVLSELQDSQGGYASWGTANAESTAQVVVALIGLGIDPDGKNFMKNGHTILSALEKYDLPDQGFRHLLSDLTPNAMATDQCACALAAYNRFQWDKTPLYDMTDVA